MLERDRTTLGTTYEGACPRFCNSRIAECFKSEDALLKLKACRNPETMKPAELPRPKPKGLFKTSTSGSRKTAKRIATNWASPGRRSCILRAALQIALNLLLLCYYMTDSTTTYTMPYNVLFHSNRFFSVLDHSNRVSIISYHIVLDCLLLHFIFM